MRNHAVGSIQKSARAWAQPEVRRGNGPRTGLSKYSQSILRDRPALIKIWDSKKSEYTSLFLNGRISELESCGTLTRTIAPIGRNTKLSFSLFLSSSDHIKAQPREILKSSYSMSHWEYSNVNRIDCQDVSQLFILTRIVYNSL